MNSIGIIGAGNMAAAIVNGIVKARLDLKIKVYDKSAESAQKLALISGNVEKCSSVALVAGESYLLLAVKPQNLSEVLEEVKRDLSDNTVILSILAGISPQKIRSGLGFDAKVIQIMPNTPMLLGAGACALCKTENVTAAEFEFAQKILNCSGISREAPADKMNEIIAINGSTPAFIYEFARCFIEYGISVNLDSKLCLELFAQTMIGSGRMMLESGSSIDELISAVCSKGGTTIEGIKSLRESGLEKTVDKACKKCVARAYELSQN